MRDVGLSLIREQDRISERNQTMNRSEFLAALRVVFDLANGCEITADEAETDEELGQAVAQATALDLIEDVLVHGLGRVDV